MSKRSDRFYALLADGKALDGMSFKRGDDSKARVQKGCVKEVFFAFKGSSCTPSVWARCRLAS